MTHKDYYANDFVKENRKTIYTTVFVYITFTKTITIMYDNLFCSDNSFYQQLAAITVLTKNSNEMFDILKNSVLGNGTRVYLTSGLWESEKELGRYHFSQELLEGDTGYGGWFINKKYHLSNELAKHILIYLQVCCLMIH